MLVVALLDFPVELEPGLLDRVEPVLAALGQEGGQLAESVSRLFSEHSLMFCQEALHLGEEGQLACVPELLETLLDEAVGQKAEMQGVGLEAAQVG